MFEKTLVFIGIPEQVSNKTPEKTQDLRPKTKKKEAIVPKHSCSLSQKIINSVFVCIYSLIILKVEVFSSVFNLTKYKPDCKVEMLISSKIL